MVRLGLRAVEIPWSRPCTSYFIPGISALYGGLVVFAISDTPRSSPYGVYSAVLGEIEQPRLCLPSRPDLYKHDLSTVSQPQHCPGRENNAGIDSTSEPIRTHHTILRIVRYSIHLVSILVQNNWIRSDRTIKFGWDRRQQQPKDPKVVPGRVFLFVPVGHSASEVLPMRGKRQSPSCCVAFFFLLASCGGKVGRQQIFFVLFLPVCLACRHLVLFAGRCGPGLCRLVRIVAAGIGDLQ